MFQTQDSGWAREREARHAAHGRETTGHESPASAQPTRRRHGHRLGARETGVVIDVRPANVRHRHDVDGRGFSKQQKFFHPAPEGGILRQLLAGSVLSRLGNLAEIARSAAVERELEGLRGRHHFRVVVKHFHPTDHLDDIPQRAVGTEPRQQETANGDITPHVWTVVFCPRAASLNFLPLSLLAERGMKLGAPQLRRSIIGFENEDRSLLGANGKQGVIGTPRELRGGGGHLHFGDQWVLARRRPEAEFAVG